ncbi:hypothetical protein BS78_08G091900 [Paspalum vaginatum]|nr:hypothetical protein BS78_08G091900 [Paspalum vaginatum]KAJ1265641.1 hypothetical protein BS78_08G091900 [Paspalum vaginatum]
MDSQVSIDDKDWPEVRAINNYAIFMGYLFMGVRGLGLLVLTWTTVVLLGGFVSMLQKKDFWCLTVITLVQTAGVFDFLLKEKASDTVKSLKGWLVAVVAAVLRPFKRDKDDKSVSKSKQDKEPSIARMVLVLVLLFLQMLVLATVLCILATLYMLGLCISTGISLWRLIQHDYGGGNNADGFMNLKPALTVLYSLAVAQGVVYGYRTMYNWVARNGLVEGVVKVYSLETSIVSDYLDKTLAGCMKDPSLARGRNLITYAVDLLVEPKTRYSYISGVLILGKALKSNQFVCAHGGQSGLIKLLLTGSATFNHMVQRLVETFGPTSPYSTEIKECAAWIVANVAGHIHLNQFSEGMMTRCLSALLDTFEDYSWRPEGYEAHGYYGHLGYERGWLLEEKEYTYLHIDRIPTNGSGGSSGNNNDLIQGYQCLVVQGLRILQMLTIDEDNCRVISNTEGLLYKTMMPLICDQLHRDHHGEWSGIAEESLELIKRLMATPGDTKIKIRSEMSSISQAIISALKGTLGCPKCEVMLKRQAVEVLLDLSVDTSTIVSCAAGSSGGIVICILLHIYLLPDYLFDRMSGSIHWVKKSSDFTRLAGECLHLAFLPAGKSSESNEARAESMPEAVRLAFGNLTSSVINGAQDNANRIHAAKILRDLCMRYTKDDEYLK